ncbi:hypothetical protein H6S82_00390 [Planktothrix sp. FACHB-1355]|uniref:hypothetical protein n=1 Tax=Planktothrix sp. FACHB-1355 TaxID=2692854 RepID=UPI00168ADB06|nr:hypothetical protein [Planktothrix sp. FACHB-1355]MBD3557327.1 hypothetical protein [Planktothrix sp. FACHB-1355]
MWRPRCSTRLLDLSRQLGEVAIEVLDNFLMPPSRAVANGEPFGQVWPPTGLWQVSSTTLVNPQPKS